MIGLALVGLPSPSGCRSIKGPIDKLLRSLGKGLIAIPCPSHISEFSSFRRSVKQSGEQEVLFQVKSN